ASVGGDPSLADIVKMVHPRPTSPSRSALYAYVLGRPHDAAALPEMVRQYEAFKRNPGDFVGDQIPDVPMEMLTSLNLSKAHWTAIAGRVSWQTLRMNLNTFTRHGAFETKEAIDRAAAKLRDPAAIERARVFPYQLMAAYVNADASVPRDLVDALQDAMELAVGNVPELPGDVWVLPDVSGSMRSPITGHRQGATSKVRCVDVAGLVAAAILRKNSRARVWPFSDGVINARLNPRDSIMSNAQRLASLPGGGTNCSVPLKTINQTRHRVDLVVFVSDNESWMDSNGVGRQTGMMEEWLKVKRRSPNAKLVCLDLQPNTTTQATSSRDVLNVGGFSDTVFEVISTFCNSTPDPDHWVRVIERETI
ncbi:MAG: vWA domain-containing protein, partial [Phycisphaerales bacterium]